MEPSQLEQWVQQAKDGDKAALEDVVRGVQDKVYGLAMRMLADPSEAQDAAQEILIKVVTHLGSFRGESRFTTWVYRVASNHLLNARKRRAQMEAMTFDSLAGVIDQVPDAAPSPLPAESADELVVEEMRVTCTQAMLCCLDREQRLVYILGDILELSGEEGAAVMEIGHDAFRQRLSRARRLLVDFMKEKCGVYDEANRCRCDLAVPLAMRTGMLDPQQLRFASHPRNSEAQNAYLQDFAGLLNAALIFRSHPDYRAPEAFVEALRETVRASFTH